jgi:hypothetical protein
VIEVRSDRIDDKDENCEKELVIQNEKWRTDKYVKLLLFVSGEYEGKNSSF